MGQHELSLLNGEIYSVPYIRNDFWFKMGSRTIPSETSLISLSFIKFGITDFNGDHTISFSYLLQHNSWVSETRENFINNTFRIKCIQISNNYILKPIIDTQIAKLIISTRNTIQFLTKDI